ncbi:MAG: hypothetical protein H7244_13235 [Herminiimonas sp.]|nr:hypothetical protein [Herminiimonas sp.]
MTPLIKHVLATTAVLAVGRQPLSAFSFSRHPDGDHHDHATAAGGHTRAKGMAHPPSALPATNPKEGKP